VKSKTDQQKFKIFTRLMDYGVITTEFAVGRKWTTKLSTRIGEIEITLGIKISRERVKWGDTHGTRYWLYNNQIDDLRNLRQIGKLDYVAWL